MKKKILLMLFPLLAMSLTACEKGNPNPDPAPVEKVVDSLSVKTQPTKTIYAPGESFDGSGMVLTVNYVGGTSEDISNGWTLNPAGPLNVSDTKVTVTYGGKSVDVTITVTEEVALSLDKSTATIDVGASVQVTAMVVNTEEAVVWSIDKTNIASLSSAGKVATVTGVAKGTATLKAAVAGLEKTCVITVNEKGVETDYGTEENPISISAAAAILDAECVNDGDMTKQAITAIGEVKEIKNTFSYESGPCFEMDMTDGSSDVYLYRCHATAELAAKVAVGSTVKFVGYAKNFKGTKEFVDNGANQCHVLSAEVVVKDVKSVDSIASGIPSYVYVGDKITASNVVLNVTYSNDETGTENATSIVLDTSVAGKGVLGKAYYGDTLYADFTIDVEPKPADPVIGKTFTKITSDAELADGTYMIVFEDDTSPKVSNGTETPVAATIENYSIVGVEGQGAFEIKAMTGGYYIKAINGEKEGKYLSGTSGSNKTNFNDEPQANTISISDGVAIITSETSVLRYNTQSNIFRYYKESSYASQAAVSLYKQGETKKVESVAISGSLTKPTQYVGDTFDPTGLTVTATYEGGETADVTSKATWSVSELITANPALEVTASFGGETSNAITVEVVAVELTSIEVVIDAAAIKKTYVAGDAWSSAGISVKGHYNNGSEAILNAEDYDLSYNPTDPAVGVESVVVTATLKAGGVDPASKTMTGFIVNADPQPALDYIEITQNPTKTEYNEGEQFIPEGLKISAHYTLGKSPETKVWGDDGLTYDAPEQFTPTAKTVTIKYTEDGETRTKDLDVTVIPKTESSIKEAYLAGEALSNGGATSQSYTFSGVIVEMRHGTSSDYEYFVQDGEYGMLVFSKGAAISGFAVGKKVQVTSTIQKYNGTIETKTISSSSVIGDAPVPSSTEITSTAVLESTKQNIRANITGVVSAKTNFGTNNDETLSLTVGSDTIKVFIKKTLYSQFGTTIESINVGDTITISDGVRGIYTNNSNVTTHQVLVCDTSSLSKYVTEVTGVSISGDFSKKSYNIGNDWDVSGLVFIGTTKDGNITLNKNDFDFSFNPEKASTIGQNQSVEVTATYKAKPELNASITINGIEVKQSQGELEEVYSFLTKDYAGGNNQYDKNADIECGDVTWNFTGNGEMLPWRFGGKNISSGADRPLYSLNPISTTKEISTAIVSIGETGGSCTFTSMSFEVYSTADGAKNGTASALVESFNVSSPKASTDYTFEATEVNSWKGMYIRVVFSVKVSGGSNKYYQLLGLTFKGIN